ncbi:hypothetical protein NM74_06055 [Aeromonas hydrophila]|uniref:hypothetical protein n=1 Tax=Aeromonas hydrophila TaxID=644 RepID=UPI00053901BD|nr:hypothetical protein [Aeromonas hydrophila]KHA57470.1 hypothetical protein NM74_06055 [Aeromonas hydrophila]
MNKFVLIALIAVVAMASSAVYAVAITVNAEYKPKPWDAAKPEFVITDKCDASFHPAEYCKDGLARFVTVESDISRVTRHNGSPWHRAFFFKVAAEKTVQLVHNDSGHSANMLFQFTHMGTRSIGLNGTLIYLGNTAGICYGSGTYYYGKRSLTYVMSIYRKDQPSGGACYANKDFSSSYAGEQTKINKVLFGYRLIAPDPLKLKNGIYTGRLQLSLGSRRDIDLGSGPYHSPQSIDITFKFLVKHQLKVDFPLAEKKLVLEPPGGWDDRLYRGRTLEAILPARIWVASPYNVSLKCQYPDARGEQCQIKNNSNDHKVVVNVSAKGKSGYWKIYAHQQEKFYGHDILKGDYRPFRFSVEKERVQEMMRYPGSTYTGNITIVIDAAI